MRMASFAFMMLLLALAGSSALAQTATPSEIAFWETVRDSKNPAELQAYLQSFPNGMFAPIARARLSALGAKPAPAPSAPTQSAPERPAAPVIASTAPTAVAAEKRIPQAGDTWIYRLSYPRLRGQWGRPTRPQAMHAIAVSSVADDRIVDLLSVDGGTPVTFSHASGPTLLAQGMSIFSPYLAAFTSLPVTGRLGAVAISEPACVRGFFCNAKGRISGRETVQVPAGKFLAAKVVVDQEWRGGAPRSTGGRTLTVWYAPEVSRAVKFSSRLVVGDLTPMDADFDLELVSYQLK